MYLGARQEKAGKMAGKFFSAEAKAIAFSVLVLVPSTSSRGD
jgi:hypothetical protein